MKRVTKPSRFKKIFSLRLRQPVFLKSDIVEIVTLNSSHTPGEFPPGGMQHFLCQKSIPMENF